MSSKQIGARTECDVVNGNIINNTIVKYVTISNPSTSEVKEVWYNLKPPVTSFTGRDIELMEMQNIFQPEHEGASSRYAAIIGVGGTGKTELARKYAALNSSYYKNIVWVDSETPANLTFTFTTLAKDHLCIMKDEENCRIEVIVTKVYEYLSKSKTLIIFDNAEGFQTIEQFLPLLIKGNMKNIHTLFTSQIKEWEVMDEDDIKKIQLNDLLPEEAKEFVKKSLKQNDVPDNDIKQLIEELAFFPLVLAQAVAYINRQHEILQKLKNYTYGIADYLIEFRDDDEAIKLLDPNTIHHRYSKTVYKNLGLTLNKISKEEEGEEAVELISMIAYIAPDDIDIDGIFKVNQNVILLLDKYSVIKLSGGVSSIHRLLQQVIRLRNRNNEIAILRKTLSVLGKCHKDYLDSNYQVHLLFVWSYAIKHIAFIKKLTSYTYGYLNITPLHIFVQYNNYEAMLALLLNLLRKESEMICNQKNVIGQTPLHLAVSSSQNLNIVKLLVKHGADINAKTKNGETPLLEAASWKDDDSPTPLHEAASNTNLKIIKFLIGSGSDVNVKNNYGRTPLHEAASNSNLNIIKLLVKHGADIKAKMDNGETPLLKAFDFGTNLDIIKFLIESGSDINAKMDKGKTPLLKAFGWNTNLDIIKFLIESGSDVNVKDNYDETPLHEAAWRENFEVTKFLIERGSDINAKNVRGETPLHVAAWNKNLEVSKFLIERGSDINAKNGRGATPLHEAASNKNWEVTKFLIERGSDINAKNGNGATPLHEAASNSNLNVAKFLIEMGSDINVKDECGASPLHKAVLNSNLDVTKFLVESGSNIDAKNEDGETPLHVAACWNKNLDVTKFLIERGFDVNVKNKNGETPLHKALSFWNKNLDVAMFLIERGSDINAKDKDGTTPLHIAATRAENSDDSDSDIDFEDEDVETLPEAWNENSDYELSDNIEDEHEDGKTLQIIKFLIEKGADVNSKDKDGQTPLHKAAYYEHMNIIDCLIENGANIKVKDNSGAVYNKQ